MTPEFALLLILLLPLVKNSDPVALPFMFIPNLTLQINPISNFIAPYAQEECQSGTMFYWEPVNESLPFLHMSMSNLAYSVSSNLNQANDTCNLCLLTETGGLFKPIDNANFQVDFIPYCSESLECYVYGIVHTPPYDAYQTLENAQTNQTYGAPHPCSDVLGLDSGYLKVSGMSCSGCEEFLQPILCSNTMSFYIGNSTPPMRYEGITMSGLLVPFLLTLIPFLILPYFILVLYIFFTSPEFSKIPCYKLMVIHGISCILCIITNAFFGGLMGITYLPVTVNMIATSLTFSNGLLMDYAVLAIALNRWDIFNGLDLRPSVDRSIVFNTLAVILILRWLVNVIIYLIPGFRAIWYFIPPSVGGPAMNAFFEYLSLKVSNIVYYETLVARGASLVLYIWCFVSMVYQSITTTWLLNRKEFFLFLQCMIPCVLIVLLNALLYISLPPWYYLYVNTTVFSLEAAHHPLIYTALNTSLRVELKSFFKKKFTKTSVKTITVAQAPTK